ncbi:MAG TPA: DUF1553 domain-containing protein [Opitutaceae bacterium]|nr:DUF1553 domain-containing protein [Opitutaceae bacterium]
MLSLPRFLFRCWLGVFAGATLAAAEAPPLAPMENPFELAAPPVAKSKIDELVFARLAQLGIEPAHVCSDAVFVRRVYLDAIGTLPTVAEARDFLRDQNPAKRRALIDRLLARPEFADYWTMKWSDLLRVKAEFPINLWPDAAQAYHRWIFESIRDNKPFDRFARELLTANGSNFRVGQVNFFRAVQNKEPASLARAVALAFMGTRAENWPPERLAGMAAFFSQLSYKSTGEWKEEIVFFDPQKTAPAGSPAAIFPDGTRATSAPDRDPRAVFADWLIDPKNPWFTRAIANRVWSWLLGRGIVHEPDDLRPDNPPSNPELLAHLERQLVAAHYDVKQLMRAILNSTTYQLSAFARSDRPEAEANFAFYAPRRLDAEVLIDALNAITGTTEKYSSAIPEPFTYIPEDQRSIELPDGSITSTFLEMFGRPARDTGFESERNNLLTATQRLTLLNSTQVQRKLEQGPKLQQILRGRNGPFAVVDTLYLTILSRPPTAAERETIRTHAELAHLDERAAALDLAWALINSTEFLYRH